MAKPEISGSLRSTYTRVVCLVCEEKGIDYALSETPLRAALVEQWVSFVNTAVDRTVIRTYLYAYIAPKTADGSPDRAAIEAVLPELRQQVAVLDKAVAATGHLVDAELTFADLNLLPLLHRLGQAPEGAETLAEARHLAAYYARHAARPSFQRTMPPAAAPSTAPSPSARAQDALYLQ